MKATNLRIFAAFLMLIAGVSASAQSSSTLRVNIPFDFVVGDQKFSAGQYSVQDAEPNGLVTLYGRDNKQTAMVLSEPAAPQFGEGEARLTFEKRDGLNYLVRFLPSSGSPRSLQIHSVK